MTDVMIGEEAMLRKLIESMTKASGAGLHQSFKIYDEAKEAERTASQDALNDIRILSKQQIEAFEHWSRRLIDDCFREDYGQDYIDAIVVDNQPIINSERKKAIRKRMTANPQRYPRTIDAIMLDDIMYFFTRKDLYEMYFKVVLEPFYSGPNDVRLQLNRLIEIRNKLYHDNAISFREAEQVLCYTNDFIDVFKDYYRRVGKERDYNVPTFICMSDSQGNRVFRTDERYIWKVRSETVDFMRRHGDLYPDAIVTDHRSGERYEVEIEVDSSFSRDSYRIEWVLDANYVEFQSGEGSHVTIIFSDDMVSHIPVIKVKLITNKNWHRFASMGCDDYLEITLQKVLPPIEDAY